MWYRGRNLDVVDAPPATTIGPQGLKPDRDAVGCVVCFDIDTDLQLIVQAMPILPARADRT